MKFVVLILTLLSFYKSIYYAMFEYTEKENKLAGIGVYVISIIGLILPIWVALSWY